MLSRPKELRSCQVQAVALAGVPALALYADPRMGKTMMSTYSIVRWIQEFGVRRIFVTGPLEPLRIVWQRELRAIGCLRPSEEGDRLAHLVPLLDQSLTKSRFIGRKLAEKKVVPARIEVLRQLSMGAAGDTPVVVLMNDEVLGRPIRKPTKSDPSPPRVADFVGAWQPEAVIGDESHRYQHAGAQRSGALRRLAQGARFKRLLSGTPDPKKAISLYHQYKILDPSIFGTSKRKFMERYCYTMGQHGQHIIGYRNEVELMQRVRSRALVIRAQDYYDTPPIEEIVRHVELDATRKAWYKKFIKEQALEIESLGVDISAVHSLARLLRCQQFTSGFLPTTEDDPEDVVWLHDAKVEAVVGDIEDLVEAGHKVVVSHLFKPEGPRLVAALQKRYGERTVVQLSAKTKDREAVIAPFSIDADDASDVRILVKSEKIGGYGLSLARADDLVFASWSMNYADVEQSRKRIWHQDKQRMTVTFMAVPGTVDVTALRNVQDKGAASIMARPFADLALGEVA